MFKHEEYYHNQQAPKKIVPYVYKLVEPSSVVDIGCGLGTFLHEFRRLGVDDLLGIDGEWVDRDLLFKNIEPDQFLQKDLTRKVDIGRRFDLAVSLEVAEHIPEEYSENFLDTLTGLSDMILFSAAIPQQGGYNHFNERWVGYWIEKFKKRGYSFHDLLRPVFWNDDDIFWWYRQNMFLVVKDTAETDFSNIEEIEDNRIHDHIHPDLFTALAARFNKAHSGDEKFIYYIKLFIKYILRRLRLR